MIRLLGLATLGALVAVPTPSAPAQPRGLSHRPTVTLALRQVLSDANIVAIFDAANTADIETGELGARNAKSKEVRDLGKMFAEAHRTVRQQGRDLATKLGVTPVLPDGDQGAAQLAAAMKSLRAASGTDFDRVFLAHEVAYHQAVIDAVTKTLLPAIQNAELKAFVEQIAPAFQGHLLAAQNLQKKLGY